MRSARTITLLSVLAIMLIAAPNAFAVVLSVGNDSCDQGATVQIPITVDAPSAIAGAAFTATYDSANLTLTNVGSTFFDTFANQWIALDPLPDPLPPDSVEVGGQLYVQPLILNDVAGGTMIAAARCQSGETSITLFTLTFTVDINAPLGDYTINIIPSNINNTDAGYDAGGEDIPYLIGAIDGEADLTQAFPVIEVTQVNSGALTVQGNDTDNDGLTNVQETNIYHTDPNNPDTDGDGIQDGTELGYTLADVGSDTDTNVFQPDQDPGTTTNPLNSDTDRDGLSDGQEDTNHDGAVNNDERDPAYKDNTFCPDSASITNPFVPINTVKKLIYAGYGALEGYERYIEVAGTEVIDNVNCAKVLTKGHGNNPDPELDPEWYYSWIAQDTDEVVWVLQRYIAEEDTIEFFGTNNAIVLMPSDPVIGQTYNHIESEYSQITDTGVTVPELNTGLGPYTNCIKTMWTDGISDVDFEYHAPNIGHVKIEWDSGITKGWELKEIIYYSPTKDELAIDFKTTGIYVYNSSIWNKIYQGVDPDRLCSFATYLAVDFGTTYGLYVYDAGAWTKVYKGVAIEKMAGFGENLAIDFGTSYPLYEYNFAADTWTPIYNYSAPRDTIEALGDKLVVDFKTAGIYVYDAGIWNRIYKGVDPVNIVSFGDKLAIDFGTAYGLYVYEYDTDNWSRVYKGVAIEKMAEIDGDLAIDFGTAYGLYVYEFNTDNWTRVYKGAAIEKMAGFDGNLAIDFGTTYPIYEYNFGTDNWNSIYRYSSPRDKLVPANILD